LIAALQEPTAPLLRLRGLTTEIRTDRGVARVCDAIDLDLARGQVLGLVGESGSGKSMTALTVLGLLPRSVPHAVSGRAEFDGVDLAALSPKEMRRLRGTRIGMVFQSPGTSLDPVYTVGDHLAEALRRRGIGDRAAVRARGVELLEQVRIARPADRLGSYPWELSGGMQQRVMIALALAGDPDLLIADEPTTALDVTVQARVLDLVRALVAERGLGVLLITHDLGVVAGTCDAVAVMYAGRIVETGSARDLFADPLHPYTAGLLASVRALDRGRRGGALAAIGGQAPPLTDLPSGCAFRTRCPRAMAKCAEIVPPVTGADGRTVRCLLHA
jgi:peptide/nickel transport system ATP-binding protein